MKRALIIGSVLVLVFMLVPIPISASIAFDNTGHVIGVSTDEVDVIVVADLDSDGDLDIVSGSGPAENYEIIAWENDGTPFDGSWIRHNMGTSSDKVVSLAVADLDKDGDLDIVSGSGPNEDYEIIAWEKTGPWTWVPHDVGAVNGAARVAVADLDKDSWIDIVSVESNYGPPGNVTIWQNDHSPFSGLWTGSVLLSGYTMAGLDVADLDNDGDLDIICNYNEYFVIAMENDGSPFVGLWNYGNVGYAGFGTVTGIKAVDFNADGYLRSRDCSSIYTIRGRESLAE